MRKAFKIILAVIAILVIIVVAIGALIFLDLAAYTATSSQTLNPTVQPMGTALVLYDPGLTGFSTRVANQVANDLLAKNMTVTVAGIKSAVASNTTGYDIIIIGGPIYAGTPTASVKDALNALANNHDSDARIGVYGSGQGSTTPEDVAQIKTVIPTSDPALQNAVVVKIGESEDLNVRTQDFANQVYG